METGIVPLPTNLQGDSKMAEVGKNIWFDMTLTANKEGSCEACHKLANNRPDVCFEVPSANCNTCHVAPIRGSGGDGRALYQKSDGKNGTRNTLSVWNSRFNIGYGWEARELDLDSFIKSHLIDANITGVSEDALLNKINKNPEYRKLFKGSITLDEVSAALGEFVRTLVAVNSRFDLYIGGNKDALSRQEQDGYEIFRKKGCVICHNGINIGGNSFKTFGVYKLHKLNDKVGWFKLLDSTFEDENLRREDTGAFRLTGLASDKYLFRVASLRNVELNRPYFTQGQVWSLEEAIRTMGRVQLGIELTDEEVSALRAFLGSLSGRIPVVQPPSKKEF
jgi:cytochrome c peroxidase